jgi:hypothetical protein
MKASQIPRYEQDLLDDLRNQPAYAEKYLRTAARDSGEALLVALVDVAGLGEPARRSHQSRLAP